MSAPSAEDRKRLASIEAGQEGHVYDNCYLCWLIARLKEAWAVPLPLEQRDAWLVARDEKARM